MLIKLSRIDIRSFFKLVVGEVIDGRTGIGKVTSPCKTARRSPL